MKIKERSEACFAVITGVGPGTHPASCTMGTGYSREVKSSRGVTLTPYPLLVPWTRKGRAIPLLPLWAVWPIQSLSACIRVHFTLWAGYRSRYSHWLRAGRSGDRIPVGARFSAPVHTGPGAHPGSCTIGTVSFPGVKSGRGVTLTPHPF
jgi:hypothetical protein